MNLFTIGGCYLQLILLTHLITVLMGAPLIDDMLRTFLFSAWLVIIGFSPIILTCQGSLRQIYSLLWHDDTHLPIDGLTMNFYRLWTKTVAWSTVIGAWFGAFPIPLDWDRWWQRWPITCFVSATLGALFSPFLCYVLLWRRRRSHSHKNRE